MSWWSSRADPQRWEPGTIHMQPLPSSTSSRATHADICTCGVSTGHAGESWCQEVVPPMSFGLYCTWSCQMRSSLAPVMRATSVTIDGLRLRRANASLACQMLTICHTGRPSFLDRSLQRTGRRPSGKSVVVRTRSSSPRSSSTWASSSTRSPRTNPRSRNSRTCASLSMTTQYTRGRLSP